MALFDRIRFAKNIGLRFTLLRLIASVLCPQYRMRYNVLDWMSDESFIRYLQLVGEAGGLKSINAGRRWTIYQLIRLTKDVLGDTAECGVFRGATSYVIAAFGAQSQPAKSHHMFDSFEGLSAPVAQDGTHWQPNDLDDSFGPAQARLSRFPSARFYKGWIPEHFPEVSERRFSFVHIDVDLYEPTRDSIAFFYPRLNPGGIVVCDDYGSAACPGATKAMDDFLRDTPEKIVGLSDGGGFFIKGVPTAGTFALM